jgi:YHS domain-containing protein
MRNILGFATAFAAALLLVGIVRASVLTKDGAVAPIADHSEHNKPQSQPEKKDEGGEKTDGDKKPVERPVEKPAEIVDLGNENDPVTGEKLDETKVTLEHKSWRIGFAKDESKKKFEKNPVRYYAKLSLEPGKDKLTKVDASKYEKATAEKCAIMGGDIDPDGEVYILHRGFKIYFCCWSGCADEFLKDPSKYYAHYGLEEKDGKLVKK